MRRIPLRVLALALAAALVGGCVPVDFLQPEHPAETTPLVPTSPFNSPPPSAAPVFNVSKPKTTDNGLAIKVDEIGQKLLATNRAIGMKPLFLTIGAPQLEIFHRDTTALYITEGLVRQCKTEAQLAAVLSVELGRMVAEREAVAGPAAQAARAAPLAVPMGNAGQFSGVEQLQQAERATLEPRRPGKKFVPPDPLVLAGGYLDAAGFDRRELTAVAPLLEQAEKNYILEKQFKGGGSGPQWAPQ
jgi:hypothetical protein